MKTSFHHALRRHQAGRLSEAEQGYRQVLARNPNHADALHLLGVIASEAGKPDSATALIARAIKVGGAQAAYCSSLGLALHRLGKLDGAIACFKESLRVEPDEARTLMQLGRALFSRQSWDEAICVFQRVTELWPKVAQVHSDLGNALHAAQQFDAAANAYSTAASLAPDDPEAPYNLGVTRTMQQRFSEAMEAYRTVIRLRPDHPDAQNNLGILLHSANQRQLAQEHFRRSGSVQAQYNLATGLQEDAELEFAEAAYRELLTQHPKHADARNNLGNVLLGLGQPAAARDELLVALSVNPEHVEAHWNLAIAELSLGNFQSGWREFEWRLRQKGNLPRHFHVPEWDGLALGGKRILLHAEQGLGDAIQFMRYVPLIESLGGSIVLETHRALGPLLRQTSTVQQWVARGEALPPVDCHAPLLSLPRLLWPEAIPATAPYLQADPVLVTGSKSRIDEHLGGQRYLKVALTWSGSAQYRNNDARSLNEANLQLFLSQLSKVNGTKFFSLQKGRAPSSQIEVIQLEDDTTDLADVAAILQNMDLLISVDTSIAHLAGALGRPVWTLLPFAPDWRWMTDRPDSPWYPTMRLFRQPSRNAWAPVIEQVRQELSRLQQSFSQSPCDPGESINNVQDH